MFALNGQPVPTGGSHWAPGLTIDGVPALMGPYQTNRRLTTLDAALLADIGWESGVPPPGRGVLGSDGTTTGVGDPAGDPPDVPGGVRSAAVDFNRDGIPDLVVGTGPGTTARVRVLDGRDTRELFAITPFGDFTGGVYVAAGDLNGDGVADLVISPDEGGGPRILALSGLDNFARLADFFGIADPNFRGGCRVAVGDVTGDGVPDLVAGAGPGGGSRVRVFDAATLAELNSYAAYSPPFENVGVVVAGR